MPNRERIALWVEALRSGEFKQARKQLRRKRRDGSYGYCCLGVACELYRRETGEGAWTKETTFSAPYEQRDLALPRAVREWLGVDDWSLRVGADASDDLIGMNDRGCKFPTIADAIEREWLKEEV